MKLPTFLKKTKLTDEDRTGLSHILRNWLELNKYLKETYPPVETLNKLMILELQRPNPREQIIDRLLSRRHKRLRSKEAREIYALEEIWETKDILSE